MPTNEIRMDGGERGEDGRLTEDQRAGLDEVAQGAKALVTFAERQRDEDPRPVRFEGERVTGFCMLASLETRTLMQGACISMTDLKNFSASIISVIYKQMDEAEFFTYMMQLTRAVKEAAAKTHVIKETK